MSLYITTAFYREPSLSLLTEEHGKTSAYNPEVSSLVERVFAACDFAVDFFVENLFKFRRKSINEKIEVPLRNLGVITNFFPHSLELGWTRYAVVICFGYVAPFWVRIVLVYIVLVREELQKIVFGERSVRC